MAGKIDYLVNFKPVIEGDGLTSEAKSKLEKSVQKAIDGQATKNSKLVKQAENELASFLGKPAEMVINTRFEVNNVTGGLKLIRTETGKTSQAVLDSIAKTVQAQGQASIDAKQRLVEENKLIDEQIQKIEKLTAAGREKALSRSGTMGPMPAAQAQEAMPPSSVKRIGQANQELKKMQMNAEATRAIMQHIKTPASLKGELAKVNQELSRTERYVIGQATAWEKLNPGVKTFGDRILRVNPEFAKLQGQSKQLSGELEKMAGGGGKGLTKMMGTINQLSFAFAAVAGAIAAVIGVMNMFIGRQKALQSLKLTLDGVGVSFANQDAVLKAARATALTYGVSIQKIEAAYQRLTPAILEAGGTLDDSRNSIEAIAARTTMLGLNAEKSGRYMEAFAQVIGKGKLQSEELNQQFSELDGALRGQLQNWLLANKGITDFEGAMKRGEITSKVFLEAFNAINAEIKDKFKRNIDQVQTSIDKLGSKGGQTITQFQQKLGALQTIGLESVGEALAPIGRHLASIYAAFVQVFTKIATEMPGLQKAWQVAGEVLGGTVKFALNGIILLVGVIAAGTNEMYLAIERFINAALQMPIVGDILRAIADGLGALGRNLDQGIDSFSALSDETKGVGAEFKDFSDEIAELEGKMEDLEGAGKGNNKEWKEYNKQLEELKKKQAEEDIKKQNVALKEQQSILDSTAESLAAQAKQKEEEYNKAKAVFDAMVANEKAGIEEKERSLEKEKEAIQKVIDANDKKSEKAIKAIEKELEAHDKLIESQKKIIEDQNFLEKRNYEAEKDAVADRYDAEIEAIADVKDSLESAHEVTMSNLNSQKDKIESAYETTSNNLSKQKDQVESTYADEQAQIEATKSAMEQRYEDEANRLKDKKEGIENRYKNETAGIKGVKAMTEAYYAEELTKLKQRKDAAERGYDSRLNNIKKTKDASERAHAARMRELDSELEASRKILQNVQERINKQKAASQARSDTKISELEGNTPAEKELLELQKKKLEYKARDISLSREERLEAQAALERADAEAKIKELESQEAIKQAKLDEKLRKAQEAAAARDLQIAQKKEEMQNAQEARMERLAILEVKINEAKAAMLEKMKSAEEGLNADREAAISDLDSKATQAENNRKAGLSSISAQEDGLNEKREGDIESIDKQESDSESNRTTAIGEIEEKEEEAQEKKEKRIEDIDDLMEQAKEDQKTRIGEIDEEEDRLQKEKESRLDDIENKHKKFKQNQEDRMKALDEADEEYTEDQEQRIQDIDDANETSKENQLDRIGEIDDALEDLKDQLESVEDKIREHETAQNDVTIRVGETQSSLENMATVLNDRYNDWKDIADEAQRAADAAADLAKSSPSGGTTTTTTTGGGEKMGPGYWTGGAISGGTIATVNERGPEGFLSNSGKLSAIKAPAFGQWKAPSSGTVIPAHVWKDMKNSGSQFQEGRIRKAVDINTGVGNSNSAKVNGVAGMATALMSAMSGGDQFNNNITIQTNNPTKSAGDMMVAMARMRHRR